ncbi:hypothetical protein DRN67_04000 [Candidatus Micrarchaeota archaeon]|nr:MAG: hypothetical protein DRN67_04000 [Candidatus Micrarchaeota archaeon]
MNFYTFLDLTRIEHSFMLALATIIGEILVLGSVPSIDFLLLTAAPPFLIGIAAFSLNDLLDVEADRINRRTDRPLVSGSASKRDAIDITLFGFIFGNGIAFFISWPAFLIALFFSLFAILYNIILKDLPLLGNVYIASTMAIPFLFGSVVAANTITDSIAVISTIAFLVGLGRELMKTAEDVEGDEQARKSTTLPIVIGVEKTILIGAALYVLAIFLSFIPVQSEGPYSWDPAYFIPIACADALFAFAAYKPVMEGKSALRNARNLTLLALGVGLIGFLAGALM